ncbi:MAG: SDR family NAD(P)-dependent oxidoreductase [Planctomycetota bacterium]|jgi:acyl dehydratase/NAD(P)-dependent dehydrogenase (short-subunit alcohol dehydrogenase family)
MEPVSRRFTMDDQRAFAALSGDWNPIHVDEVAARRLLFGEPIVHGIHPVLWALDRLVEEDDRVRSLLAIEAFFRAPIRLGEKVTLQRGVRADGGESLKIQTKEETATEVALRPGRDALPWELDSAPFPRSGPLADDPETLGDRSGNLALSLPGSELESLFPALARGFARDRIAVLLALTRLVGMECPGERSLFSHMKLLFEDAASEPETGLAWEVRSWHPRMRRLDIALTAGGASGSIRCFVRPAPTMQPSVAEIAHLVEPGEFAEQSAMVIGGSRGLGEVTAKLIAAGGGEVALSYHRGAEDAEAIVREIEAHGGRATAFHYDLAVAGDIAVDLAAPITHLYHFAAPRIRSGPPDGFDGKLYERYLRFFAAGLRETFFRTRGVAASNLVFVNPSTVFLDEPEPGFEEYAAAKAAAEAVVDGLRSRFPQVRFMNARLPRVETDQAQSLLAVPTRDPVEVMLDELRRLPAR